MHRARLVAFAAIATVTTVLLGAQSSGRIAPSGIPVRFPEGSVHAFLELHAAAGALLASGDLVQLPESGGMRSRMTFHFADSSFFEETVRFTQRGVFALQSYRLVERGPAFAVDLDARFSANGSYSVTSRSRDDGKVSKHSGTLEMPPDVSNGLPIVLLKNLTRHDTQTVHLVAFTPAPRMIKMRLAPMAESRILNGAQREMMVQFDLKPEVGGIAGVLAKLLGKIPPDSHVWIVTQDAPMFVRFEGPLFTGPVWRIDGASPRWPR
ncbi:MAG: hypothetical protein ABIZ70_12900 [Gemmatimonadales bacterium]